MNKPKEFFNSEILNKIENQTDDILSSIYEEIFTNNCPECQIPISKNGGCSHITC